MPATYDRIGTTYESVRKPDPRIARAIRGALGDARTVLNVGAGTGSYEPPDLEVTAVEPSVVMRAQRPAGAPPAIDAVAENLPFPEDAFDASMGILTLHHWEDQHKGLAEMRRVTRGPVVLLTFDPASRPWLTDYLPGLAELDLRRMPAMDRYGAWLGEVDISPVPIPHDCTDGFLYAYWRRPNAYLDPELRAGSSSFWKLTGVEEGIESLRADLDSGAWEKRYRHLLKADSYDAGYRLVVTR